MRIFENKIVKLMLFIALSFCLYKWAATSEVFVDHKQAHAYLQRPNPEIGRTHEINEYGEKIYVTKEYKEKWEFLESNSLNWLYIFLAIILLYNINRRIVRSRALKDGSRREAS